MSICCLPGVTISSLLFICSFRLLIYHSHVLSHVQRHEENFIGNFISQITVTTHHDTPLASQICILIPNLKDMFSHVGRMYYNIIIRLKVCIS